MTPAEFIAHWHDSAGTELGSSQSFLVFGIAAPVVVFYFNSRSPHLSDTTADPTAFAGE